MKQFTVAILLTSALSACSIGTPNMSIGLGTGINLGPLGLGTSINLPVSLDKTKLGKSSDTASNNGINAIEEKIITYFDTQGTPSNSAVKNGFYRKLIQKNSNNEYLVQDFYNDGKQRTNQYTLTREQLMTFRATPNNGTRITYAYNGNIMQQQEFKNNRLVK